MGREIRHLRRPLRRAVDGQPYRRRQVRAGLSGGAVRATGGRPRYPAGAASAASLSTAASPCEASVLRALGRRRRLTSGVGAAPPGQPGLCPVVTPPFPALSPFLRSWPAPQPA